MTAGPNASWDETSYLAWKLGLGRKEAFVAYIKKAGVVFRPTGAPLRQVPTEPAESSLRSASWC
jgi:hypothetical protein